MRIIVAEAGSRALQRPRKLQERCRGKSRSVAASRFVTGALQRQDQERCSAWERYWSLAVSRRVTGDGSGALQRQRSATGALHGQDQECCSARERCRGATRHGVAGALQELLQEAGSGPKSRSLDRKFIYDDIYIVTMTCQLSCHFECGIDRSMGRIFYPDGYVA